MFIESRKTKSLTGVWQVVPDPYRRLRHCSVCEELCPRNEDSPKDFKVDDKFAINIPGSWSSQLPEFEYYEGPMYHFKRFSWEGEKKRVFLHFGAVNYRSTVWLNEKLLGSHEGGYTPFSFEITGLLREDRDNFLIVLADNTRLGEGVPTLQTDWFNFGGITRPVHLVFLPETFIRNFKVETHLQEDAVKVDVAAWIDGQLESDHLKVSLPELGVETMFDPSGEKGRINGSFSLAKEEVDLWDVRNPKLYSITLSWGGDSITDRIGFREISVGGGNILLNGTPVYLRGISMHEEVAGKGRTLNDNDVRDRFRRLRELNCNFARLAHYPHTPKMSRMADEEGILLWEEIPVWQNIQFGKEKVQNLIRQQLREMIQRDWNHPSVILWSIANETNPENPDRNRVLPEMSKYVRELDDTRLVTAACFSNEMEDGTIAIKDPLADYLDVVGINQYYGWYYGEADAMKNFVDDPNGKPIIISETGGGARWGFHDGEDELWTEENQERIYKEQIKALSGLNQVKGISPWILFDFRSPNRMNEYQRGYNRKGLLDESGREKKAFWVLQNFYRLKLHLAELP